VASYRVGQEIGWGLKTLLTWLVSVHSIASSKSIATMQKEQNASVRFFRLSLVIGLLLLGYFEALAQQLPVKIYTTADGLARDRVTRVRRDSRGFLWFCTEEGLSRFDGYGFANYTTNEGLPNNNIWDFLETRDGNYWIGTINGVCRFNPNYANQPQADQGQANRQSQMFTVYEPEGKKVLSVSALLEDRNGTIWCGSWSGIYRLERDNGDWQLRFSGITGSVYHMLEDRQGTIWIATGIGLYKQSLDGKVEFYNQKNGLPSNVIRGLFEASDGTIWVGTYGGVCELKPQTSPDGMIVTRVIGPKEGLPGDCNWLLQTSTGRFLVCGGQGLFELLKNGSDYRVRYYSTAQGLSAAYLWCMTEDRDGNLWMTTNSGGVMKMARNGFTTWREREGLGKDYVVGVSESRTGEFCVSSMSPEGRFISRFDGETFKTVRPFFPSEVSNFGIEAQQDNLQDSRGEWWIPTGSGLLRYPKTEKIESLAHTKPKAFYTTKDGLSGNNVFRLFEDLRGDIWIGSFGANVMTRLTRWEPATGRFYQYSAEDGTPPGTPAGFCEDHSGNLWITFHSGYITRYRDGRFTSFLLVPSMPGRRLHDIYCDRAGRIWIGSTENGLFRIDHPNESPPQPLNITVSDGLSSNDVWDITEDNFGNIYLGTGRGLDRFNPDTKQIKHYTTQDGLTSNYVLMVYRDRSGAIWMGTQKGVSRFQPEADLPIQPPPIFISSIHVAGEKHPISALGETAVTIPDLEVNQNKLTIDFFGLSLAVGESLRYQYKLEGANSDWSEPSKQRIVDFANLKPGAYRFLVRAVSTDGSYSSEAATVTFRILAPLWQRWWFITLSLLIAGSIALIITRSRRERKRERRQAEIALQLSKEERLYELEQVRRRIATDLHDDVGSSLTQISLLTEVVRQRVNGENPATEQLKLIGRISRELVDSMSDIVWSINPAKDTLNDLSQRMRLFASDVLTSKQIKVQFEAPDEKQQVKVGTNMRREIFLAFKEGVNNVARHSACREAKIEFQMNVDELILQISDDGKGFDHSRNGDGNGLSSMNERIKTLGGVFEIISRAGQGTTLKFVIPLHQELSKFR
jgi:ligand-binding sensor domain-containing protein/signal transduction histidine kinase